MAEDYGPKCRVSIISFYFVDTSPISRYRWGIKGDHMSRGTERFENDARPFNSTLETVWNEFQMRDSFKAGQVLQEFVAESFELGELVTKEVGIRSSDSQSLNCIRADWIKARDKFCQQMVDDAVDGENTYGWILDLC